MKRKSFASIESKKHINVNKEKFNFSSFYHKPINDKKIIHNIIKSFKQVIRNSNDGTGSGVGCRKNKIIILNL